MVNRVILAPRADREVRRRTEEILSEFDLDVPIEESSIGRSDITSSRDYQAELVGPDNYSSSFRYYTRHRQDFLNVGVYPQKPREGKRFKISTINS